MFNIKHNPQSGRSMIEMSGVLVLIGILSIGAVMGFNYAMDKYRASVTVNDIRLRGIDLLTRINRNQEVTLSEWDSVSSAGYLFQTPLLNDQGIALLTLTGVPPKVCDQVAQDISAEIQTAVNGVKYTGTPICSRLINDLTFYFGTDSQNTGCFGNVCITKIHRRRTPLTYVRIYLVKNVGHVILFKKDVPKRRMGQLAQTAHVTKGVA